MAWNTVYAPGDGNNFQDVEIFNRYISAMSERNYFDDPSTEAPWTGGEDLQNWTLGHLIELIPWKAFQHMAERSETGVYPTDGPFEDSFITVDWIVPGSYEGASPGGDFPFPDDIYVDFGYKKSVVLGGNGWTRKHPREFLTDTSTEYIWVDTPEDPNAFADGHYARRFDNSKVYHRVAGAWVLAPGKRPDVVTTYGQMQIGDYIGYWTLNETRDAFNLEQEAAIGELDAWIDVVGRETDFGGGLVGSEATWAAAKSNAEGIYAASSVGFYSYPAYQAAGEYNNSGSGTYSAGLTRSKARSSTTCWSSVTSADVDFYSLADVNPFSGTFNDSGDDVVNGSWHKWDTQTVVHGSATLDSIYLGSIAVPAWSPDPTASPGALITTGYVAPYTVHIFKPVFTYHA